MAEKILCDQWEIGQKSESRDGWRRHEDSQTMYGEEDTDTVCWNLFSGLPKSTAHAPCGHPLGRGCPEDVPQDFNDQFHFAREDMSDSTDELYDLSDEKPDDIIGYDTKHLRFLMIFNHEK